MRQNLLTKLFVLLLLNVRTKCWIKVENVKPVGQRGLQCDNNIFKQTELCRSLAKVAATISLLVSGLAAPTTSAASTDIPVYFGVGCFWHVQHEFVSTEMNVLGRSEADITSKAGYAGGNRKAQSEFNAAQPNKPLEDLVCYHNLLGKADYDTLGHTEVVGMSIPAETVEAFAQEYFSLYGRDSERPDKGDRGGQYRSVIGLPGGMSSKHLDSVQRALDKSGRNLRLIAGKGNDPDTLGKKLVYVMDTNTFPFHQAELYHQFHDGFMPGEKYGRKYHDIIKEVISKGRLQPTGCPDF